MNDKITALLSELTLEEKAALVGGHKSWHSVAVPRLGIPSVFLTDGPHGLRKKSESSKEIGLGSTEPATAFPTAAATASSWNAPLIEEMGDAMGKECNYYGVHVILGPAVNIKRNPLCGRNFEYFSEDPLIAGKFAAAKVNGIQSVNIGASAKHFACNNKETNRKYSDSRVSERALREIYMRGFEICVKESHPWTVMSSYNLINGRRCCTGYEQIQGILREEWVFQGMVTSDWNTPCDQTYCVLSGNDVRMPVGEPEVLKASLDSGRIQRGHLESCAKRILEMILKLD